MDGIFAAEAGTGIRKNILARTAVPSRHGR